VVENRPDAADLGELKGMRGKPVAHIIDDDESLGRVL
jgi:hypothetical protein